MVHCYIYHMLEVGLTQTREIMALRTLITVDFVPFHRAWGPAWIHIHWNSNWLRARSHTNSHYTWGPWPHYMTLEVCWDSLWTLSYGFSPFHGHGSWLVCEGALRVRTWEPVWHGLYLNWELELGFGGSASLFKSSCHRLWIHCLSRFMVWRSLRSDTS
jgi:hypothetical protein